MQDLFIKENEEFTVDFVVATDKEGTIWCDITEESLKEMVIEGKEYDFQKYKVVFKKPSFGDTISLYDSIFKTDGQSIEFNPLEARYRKIVLLLKSWDLKDSEGNEVPAKESNVMSLHPIIASIIGTQVDFITGGLLT
ncbi:MAG: hypothetical protein J7L15_04000 [Clostridiales bacterium]|nr:hypothetical protein [Clostridiales bacterium]